nr:MAG TPA: hypothetical protein [Caudoviricetes sp.]
MKDLENRFFLKLTYLKLQLNKHNIKENSSIMYLYQSISTSHHQMR